MMGYSYDISVIIPIFNAEKYLDDCLTSVCNQTLSNIEILCINDGSTDNSLKIIEKFAKKDNRIKIFNTLNNGQGSARNLGLKHACGEYISFIDADDWIRKDALYLLYSKIKEFDLDILFFQMINYIEKSKELFKTDLYDYKILVDNFDINVPFSSEDSKEFLFNIAVCPVSKLYKKSFLDKYNIIFPEDIIFEDNVFFYNAFLRAEKISFIDEELYYRRRHSESVTSNLSNKTFDIVLATNHMLMLFKENLWYEDYKKSLLNHIFSMILEWFFKADLTFCEDFYSFIKNKFIGFNEFKFDFEDNLNKKYLDIFNLFNKYDYYLDFLSEYSLLYTNYNSINNDSIYKISVIVPIYNNDKLIHRTIMSLLNQSFGFENVEIILIDDKSTDNTPQIIDDYSLKYDNIKAIHIKNNTGAAGIPRNIGIKEASADYIMFLDHDDFFEINALEKLYYEILKHDSDVVFGTYAVINNNKFTQISYPNEKHGYFDSIFDNERFVGFPPPSIWTKLFKKEFILENNILFPPILGEDAIFMNKVFFNASGIVYLPNDLICYHDLNDKSYTNNITLKYLTEGLVSEKYLYNLFLNKDKEYYFKYRCEGNLDFFLSQFLRSNLTKNEIIEILPLFSWFIDKCIYFNLKPNKTNNSIIFDYFIEKDVDSIYNFKTKLFSSKKSYFVKRIFGDKYFEILKKVYNKTKKIRK